MSKLGSPKGAFMLSMGLILYIILIALLMFYIEECSVDDGKTPRPASGLDMEYFQDQCKLIFASFGGNSTTNGSDLNVSFDGCTKIVQEVATVRNLKTPTCRFSTINYFPWVHCVAFSLMTIGGTISPVTDAGQILLSLSTIIGIIPVVRLMIHAGIIIFHAVERGILSFELRVLGRAPRMIHNIYKKIFVFIFLLLLLYNSLIAWVTSRPFYGTQWSFPKAVFFWLQGMLTIGHRIEAFNRTGFYSNGGWRSLCIDFAMIGNIMLLSSFVCAITTNIHTRNCHAIKTIRKKFRNQYPEVYLNIKQLTTHF